MTHLIERFTEHLKKGKYNSATIAAYRNAIFVFYNHFRDYPQSKITDELISNYLLGLSNNKNSKQDAIQSGKAIKLFYEVIFSKKLNLKSTGKIKQDQVIDVLSHDELFKLFNSVKNIKHKLLLMFIYNNGLKVNEIVNLEVEDVDTEANIIIIKSDNNKRKRMLRLSPNLNWHIEKYKLKHNPKKIFFPGSGGEGYYSARNIQLFFQKALFEAGINKHATLNTLRHSFAVHSLEMGMDVHILQKILGHSNIQTTTVYNQFVKLKMENLRSPLENIDIID
ncbi:XerD Site-specific recombinase XerD [Spirosomataceae bacterium]